MSTFLRQCINFSEFTILLFPTNISEISANNTCSDLTNIDYRGGMVYTCTYLLDMNFFASL